MIPSIELQAFYLSALHLADAGSTDTSQNLAGFLVSTALTSVVLAAVISGIIQILINRRNARIQERKNSSEAVNDLIARYREAAEEERKQKESAVATQAQILDLAKTQLASAESTVDRLNSIIVTMTHAANVQQDVIDQVVSERDRAQEARDRAEAIVKEQEIELDRREKEIEELTLPTAEIEQIRANRSKHDTKAV